MITENIHCKRNSSMSPLLTEVTVTEYVSFANQKMSIKNEPLHMRPRLTYL